MKKRSLTLGLTLGSAALSGVLALALGIGGASAASVAQTHTATHTATPSSNRPAVGVFTYSLPSALNIDIEHDTVTLPLYEGLTASGSPTWYIVTESSNLKDHARERGVNYSPKLDNALGTAAVQKGHFDHGTLVFDGTVNFGLKWSVVPGPNGFPPASYSYGAKGDAHYSPLVRIGKGVVINAPQVANNTGVSGSVESIDYAHHTVTLSLLTGFVDGQLTVYLHTDAVLTPGSRARAQHVHTELERDTRSRQRRAVVGVRAAIIPVVNGILGDANPMRQGLNSALLGQGDPLNVAQEQPSDPVHYSPIWDVTPVEWTAAAIAAGKRVQLHSMVDVRVEALAGNIVGALPGKPNVGLGGITAPGAISNCPIIAVFPG